MENPSLSSDETLPMLAEGTRVFTIGDWEVDLRSGRIVSATGEARLEPKVAECLAYLAARQGEVVGHAELMAAVWPDVIVGPDSLARAIFKLRAALGDDSRKPRYVENIPKRGYRLVASVMSPTTAAPPVPGTTAPRRPRARWILVPGLMLAATASLLLTRTTPQPAPASAPATAQRALTDRASDFYYQFSYAENEAAIALYEQVLATHPSDPVALTGLANALTQRVIRWPSGDATGSPGLAQALASGRLSRDPATRQLERARALAEAAVREDPTSSPAHKARGLVLAAQGGLDEALAAHQEAVRLDPDFWPAMINVADVLEIQGQGEAALPWLERAFAAMNRGYAAEPVRIRPWLVEVAVLIARRTLDRGDRTGAEQWLRRALEQSPFHQEATLLLVASLAQSGEHREAERLCHELELRTLVPAADCSALLRPL
jgi:DNA-binding winged helix-turn-helix (wHTH) protein/Tfp pilus assembly protein PilF